ncbi:hypothetical protein BJX61DRAFT_547880 [Aspergillus egyptiacus]|nr:hypothetical protein BJX61DRAFT_547880 [Aspergillus egyptiacus]
MLHFRIRALPRRQTAHPPSSAPPPTFNDPSQKENEEDDDEEEEDPEDLFTSFLPHLFPDDAPPFHGNPGQHLLYSSPRYGDLTIMVPSYPGQHEDRSKEIAAGQPDPNGGVNKVEEGRKLFAHLLWTAAMVVADGIEKDDGDSSSGMWKVEGERVLELGAG